MTAIIKNRQDIRPPLRVVNQRRVNRREVADVIDSLGRFCASGGIEFVNSFVCRWG